MLLPVFSKCLLKSTSKKSKKYRNPSSKSFEIRQITLTAPITKAVLWLCLKQTKCRKFRAGAVSEGPVTWGGVAADAYQAPQHSQRLRVLCQRPSWVGGKQQTEIWPPAQAFWLPAAIKATALPVGSKGASHQSDRRFSMAKSKMYSSIKPFIHGAAAEKQLELVPPRRVSPPESCEWSDWEVSLTIKWKKNIKRQHLVCLVWSAEESPRARFPRTHGDCWSRRRLTERRCETKRGL